MKNLILDSNNGFRAIGGGAEFSVRSTQSEVVRVVVVEGEKFDTTQYYCCSLLSVGQVWENESGFREIRNHV